MKRTASILACLVIGVGALVALVQMRPTLPDLPSIGGPLTTSVVEQTVLVALWATAGALAVGLLGSALTAAFTRAPSRRAAVPAIRSRRARRVPAIATPQARPSFTVAPPTRALPAARAASEQAAPQAIETEATQAPDPAPTTLSIFVLGPVEIEGVEQPRRTATTELIVYLALNGEATRDQLLEALWPGEDPRRTRPRLWQSVSEAGRILGDAFERARDRYQVDLARIHLDAVELERLLANSDATDDPDRRRAALETALKLWRGDPLAGADYQWADGTIRHLQAVHLDLIERVAHARLDAGDAIAALDAAEQGVASEELHEGLWRVALMAESKLGRRDAITRRYDTLRDLLDDRLGLQPESATTRLYRDLLGQT